MRRSLWWSLLAVTLLSLASLWTEDRPARIVAALERPVASLPTEHREIAAVPPAELPLRLEPNAVEPARRDIFAPVEAPAPKVQAPPPPTAPVAPTPPTAPPMTWRYLGAMTTPAGERVVMLARGEATTTIRPGTQLDEGYVVEAIGGNAVRLVYPPTGTVMEVPIPLTPPGSP